MLGNVETGAFTASYAELKGDIQQELGDLGAAQEAYEKAQQGADDDNQLLQLKLANVAMQRSKPATDAAIAKGATAKAPSEDAGPEKADPAEAADSEAGTAE